MPSFNYNSGKHFSKKVDHWFNDKHYKPEPTTSKPVSEPTKSVPDPETALKPVPVPASKSTTSMNQTELETALLKLINDDRAKVGAKPLATDSELITAARDHSAWMDSADTLSHTGKNGTSPSARIESAGNDSSVRRRISPISPNQGRCDGHVGCRSASHQPHEQPRSLRQSDELRFDRDRHRASSTAT